MTCIPSADKAIIQPIQIIEEILNTSCDVQGTICHGMPVAFRKVVMFLMLNCCGVGQVEQQVSVYAYGLCLSFEY